MAEKELTGVQAVDAAIVLYLGENPAELAKRYARTWAGYRALRRDPTVALVRELSVAPILSGEWTLEEKPDATPEMRDYVVENILPLRDTVLSNVLFYGRCDYGYQAFEKVRTERDGYVVIEKMKSLLPDISSILIDKDTGALAGIRQTANGKTVDLDMSRAAVFSFGVEGTNWYGEGLLDNVITAQQKWDECEAGAARYDKKVAGAHWVVQYPRGTSSVGGVDTPNSTVATNVLNSLKSSGSVALPRVQTDINDPGAEYKQWMVDLVSDNSARQYSFVNRLSYLDKLKVRAMLMPERAVLEGTYGTKADSSEHVDLAFSAMELTDRRIVISANQQMVDESIRINFGPEAVGLIRLAARPILDEHAAYLREVYKQVLSSPEALLSEFQDMDVDAVRDRLGIPSDPQDKFDGAWKNRDKQESDRDILGVVDDESA